MQPINSDQASLAQFKTLLDTLPDPVFMKDKNLHWIYGNKTILNLYGIDPESYIGKSDVELLPAQFSHDCVQSDLHAKALHQTYICEEQAKDAHGNICYYEVHKVPFYDEQGEFSGLIGIGRDITRRKNAEQELHDSLQKQYFISEHDELTGLLNLHGFRKKLQESMREQQALVIISLDRFRDYNDLFGHNRGDELLKNIARILQQDYKDNNPARLGAKEFALLIQDNIQTVTQNIPSRLDALIYRIQQSDLTENYQHSFSVGIAEIDRDDSIISVFAKADTAVNQAKQTQGNSVCSYTVKHTNHIQQQSDKRNQLLSLLRREDSVLAYFQPIISNNPNETLKAEVLMRFVDKHGKLFFDSHLINIAEQYGIIEQLTRKIIKLSFHQYQTWHQQKRNITLSINLSAQDLVNTQLCHWIIDYAKSCEVRPCDITFELTESQILPILDLAEHNITAIKEQGFQLALDDFGVGFTSFALLKKYHFDCLKIDGSFIKNIATNPKDYAIVKALQTISKEFQLKTVAECVENQAILDKVNELNIHYMQGWHFAKAMNAQDYEHFLDKPLF